MYENRMKIELTVIHESIRDLYSKLDADVQAAGPACEISGRCCRFEEYGHRLYMSRPEAEILFSEGVPEDAKISAENCPFQQGNLCTARENRPLGCRVYFCDPGYQEECNRLSEGYIHELKRIHEESEIRWEYASLQVFAQEFQEIERSENA